MLRALAAIAIDTAEALLFWWDFSDVADRIWAEASRKGGAA